MNPEKRSPPQTEMEGLQRSNRRDFYEHIVKEANKSPKLNKLRLSKEDREDVVNEAFQKIQQRYMAQKLPVFDGRNHITAYVLRMVYNQAVDLLRERKKWTERAPTISVDDLDNQRASAGAEMSPAEAYSVQERRRIILEELAQLTEHERLVWELKIGMRERSKPSLYEDFNAALAARGEGPLTEERMKRLLKTSREILRLSLQRRGVINTDG